LDLAGGRSGGYRADIDGLRAVAVLIIVLGHLGVRGFGGGFIGVDVFFVISGFLITGILAGDMAAGRHSIAEFYARRVIRIFPALFAMLISISILAVIFLLPGELIGYARSLVATVLFGSNVLFFTEAGYFDGASHVKPLLHTWSLGVEEQFYLLWPLLLTIIGKSRIRTVFVVGVIALVSLIAAGVMVRLDASAAFYLLPFRAWELALGGLLVFTGRLRNRWLNELMSGIGLFVILLATWKFESTMLFPGFSALAPVLGAALVIFGGPDTLTGRLLSIRLAVWIGRLSYSLYLWHWPVIVFADVGLLLVPGPAVIAAQLLLSLTLAAASLRWIETPFRLRRARWATPKILGWGLATMVLAIGMSSALILAKGIPGRFTADQQILAAYGDRDYEAGFRRGTCFAVDPGSIVDPQCLVAGGGHPRILLIGDSMAAHLWPGLAPYSAEYDILQATMVGCTPGVYPTGNKKCQRYFRDMLTKWAPEHRPDLIILAGRWQDFDIPSLEETVRALQAEGLTTLVVGPPPTYTAELPRLLVLADRRNDPGLVGRFAAPTSFGVDARLRTVSESHGARYLSLVESLCAHGTCRSLAAPGVPLQFDYGHLTPQGSAVVAGTITPEIRSAIAGSGPAKNDPSLAETGDPTR